MFLWLKIYVLYVKAIEMSHASANRFESLKSRNVISSIEASQILFRAERS